MPREHSDKGSTRALPDTAIEEIYRLKEAFPRLNATQIHRHLVEEAFIPASVSVCAAQRFVKKHDLKSLRGLMRKVDAVTVATALVHLPALADNN